MASKELPKGWKYKFPYLLVLQNHHPRGEGYNPRLVGTGQPVMSVSCTSGRHLELDWERAGLAVPTTEITCRSTKTTVRQVRGYSLLINYS